MATKPTTAPKDATLKDIRMVAGNISTKAAPDVKTSGVVTRGNGAATKGKTARGPLA